MNREQLLLEIWSLEEKLRRLDEEYEEGHPWMAELYRHELEKKQQELAVLDD